MDKNNHTKEEIQMKERNARFEKGSQLKEDAEDESSSSNEESQLDEEDVKNGSLNGEEITEDVRN